MIFVKFPEPGKVKTRLAKVLGDEEAAHAYRSLVARVAQNVVPPSGGDWAIWVVFDPAERESEVREWLDPVFGGAIDAYLPQVRGDLGERMEQALSAGFAAGFGQVALIGSDCVDLDQDGIGECWRLLREEKDVVFGPANDGGYYLVGANAPGCTAGGIDVSPVLFNGVPWSDGRTLEVSKEVAAAAGLKIGELEPLGDVDEIEDWEALAARDGR